MCGITGFVDFSRRSTPVDLNAMSDSLFHRGPDDAGNEFFETGDAFVGLGFRRLAILDLSPAGHQPMRDPSTENWIVFNGEIYNFKEIRKELEQLGHSFISHSDTEVILHAYREWGTACVSRFVGMFGICLYDSSRRKVIFFRDRAGVKPLFYYWNDGLLLFGSELKSLHRHPAFKKSMDIDALSLYFQFGYIPAPYSIFKNVYKLRPGYFMELDLSTRALVEHEYWNAETAYRLPKSKLDWKETLDHTEQLFISAFNSRMIADVPVGVFLSGGYDSSCVSALLQKHSGSRIKTFTIGFSEAAFNEADHARKVAEYLGTEHHEYTCTYREAMDIVPLLPQIYDEPFGDSSAIPTTLVSRFARKDVTVALSADAGDELFAGYPRHLKNVRYLERLKMLPFAAGSVLASLIPSANRSLDKADRMDKLKQVLRTNDPVGRFKIINQVFTFLETKSLLSKDLQSLTTVFDVHPLADTSNDDLSRILLTEYKSYLVDDILQKVDRATMSASLEGREPFLDHRILEWVATLPSSFKMKDGKQKVLLKEIVHRHIPQSIMDRPKMGFGIPLVKWMRDDLRPLFDDVMSDDSLKATGVLDVRQAGAIRDAYLNGRLENFERLWLVFSFVLWHREWMQPRV